MVSGRDVVNRPGMVSIGASVREAQRVAAAVPDPELPMVTIEDLGILRTVSEQDGRIVVELTPTYSGCPAMAEIRHDVARRLHEAGFPAVDVRLRLDPPWSTEAITAAGRRKLAEAGIAPPSGRAPAAAGPVPLTLRPIRRGVSCPHCASTETVEQSTFGSTACKALYRCQRCAEPFEYFKVH